VPKASHVPMYEVWSGTRDDNRRSSGGLLPICKAPVHADETRGEGDACHRRLAAEERFEAKIPDKNLVAVDEGGNVEWMGRSRDGRGPQMERRQLCMRNEFLNNIR
jgi:hypothetical protein